VFADRAAGPTAAAVVSHSSFTYLGGRRDRELLDFALTGSLPAADSVVICAPDRVPVPVDFIGSDRTIDRIEFSHLEPTWNGPL